MIDVNCGCTFWNCTVENVCNNTIVMLDTYDSIITPILIVLSMIGTIIVFYLLELKKRNKSGE